MSQLPTNETLANSSKAEAEVITKQTFEDRTAAQNALAAFKKDQHILITIITLPITIIVHAYKNPKASLRVIQLLGIAYFAWFGFVSYYAGGGSVMHLVTNAEICLAIAVFPWYFSRTFKKAKKHAPTSDEGGQTKRVEFLSRLYYRDAIIFIVITMATFASAVFLTWQQ